MRFGVCIGTADQLAVARDADLDYVEVSVARWVMESDAGGFARLRGEFDGVAAALAANVFLPPGIRLVGPERDTGRALPYVREAVRRLHLLGVQLLVFGSGGPRRIPDGYERRRGLDELAEFCRSIAPITQEAGITLVLEPLRRAESNVWNSVGEVATFIRDRELHGVRLLADLYHMQEDGEPLTAVIDHADLLAHTHVAGRGRTPPRPDPELTAFLVNAGQARPEISCSIECRWSDFAAELGPAVRTLRDSAPRAR
jgi:D-psicose/D-tagatose/L-ribulose 3-epimerase